jgi:penicillin amidase
LALFASISYAQQVEVLRDPWGIPHIFADSDASAFYGLGYATAEDRAFQMTYSLRIIQGRLSEVVGQVRSRNGKETSLDHDRRMRTFGFHRAANRVAANLDAETTSLLHAYCDGVNDWFRDHQDELHPLFAKTGLKPEPWTPADCLASWWHLGQFFATDGTRELISARNSGRIPQPPEGFKKLGSDDVSAVVKRTDLADEWISHVERYAKEHGVATDESGVVGPKFSHAWVVGSKRTTTGSSVLVSDPQTPVRNPSLFYEFHVRGATFDARGIGVPGSPIILIGFTPQVAWGLTALGADQADLFRLETNRSRPDEYRFDGRWRPMTVHQEVIRVKGREPVNYSLRETHLGPVTTEFCFAQPGEGDVALKRIPMCETERETIQGAIAMMRARDAREFESALAAWRFPSANVVFGDRGGNIGYRAVGAIPVRSRLDESHGRNARQGHASSDDWQEILPSEFMPQVLNPAAGFLYTANHRPIQAWYPIPLGAATGGGGDTMRSWRLNELLSARERFASEEVLAIRLDAVNPARRDIVKLGLHLRDRQKEELSDDALSALELLAPWYHSGASSSLMEPGAAVAMELNTFFRFVSTKLAYIYGGGESGLAYFLKTTADRLKRNPDVKLTESEQAFIDQSLASAWQSCNAKYGDDPSVWQERAKAAVNRQQLGYFESLDPFPALDDAQGIAIPSLADIDGGTIGCQSAQSYTQWVPMHDPDLAQSILPIGESELPGATSRTSTLELWSKGELHPAPLSRTKVEALGTSRLLLKNK